MDDVSIGLYKEIGHEVGNCPEEKGVSRRHGHYEKRWLRIQVPVREKVTCCYRCGSETHKVKECIAPSRGKRKCFGCREYGHILSACSVKDTSNSVSPSQVITHISSITRWCYRCGSADHLVKDCVLKNLGKIKCYGCGEHGHIKPQCPKKEMSEAYKAATRDENRTGRVFTLVRQPATPEGASGI